MNAVARGAPLPTDSLHRLWDALADFPVTDSEGATAFLMAALAERVGAWNATWAGAICLGSRDGDPLAGWRVGSPPRLARVPAAAIGLRPALPAVSRSRARPSPPASRRTE